jgi:hypothetical protein
MISDFRFKISEFRFANLKSAIFNLQHLIRVTPEPQHLNRNT